MLKKQLFPVILMTCLFSACSDDSGTESGKTDSCSDESFVNCYGTCIDPKSSKFYCGADATCQNYNECNVDESCVDGNCISNGSQTTKCSGGNSVLCNGTCINPKTSKDFCGANEDCSVSTRCHDDENCVDGICTSKASAEITCSGERSVLCQGNCINPKTDEAFCGANDDCSAFDACDASENCVEGICTPKSEEQPACSGDKTVRCEGNCINPKTDEAFCGANDDCSAFDACDASENCVEGICTPKSEEQPACSGDKTVRCEGNCINPENDHDYCGANTDCSSFTPCEESESCISGVCTPNSPQNPECKGERSVLCDGYCINPNNDHDYCGANADCSVSTRCKDDENCVSGKCTPGSSPITCSGNRSVLCKGNCINPKADKEFCGASADCSKYTTCTDGKSCVGGICVSTSSSACPANAPARCGDECIDPNFNDDYCGALTDCSNAKKCEGESFCFKGNCIECMSFKDNIFKQFIMTTYDKNKNNCITPDEADAVTSIPAFRFCGMDGAACSKTYKPISTLDDIKQFKNLALIGDAAFKNSNVKGDLYSDSVLRIGEKVFSSSKINSVTLTKIKGTGFDIHDDHYIGAEAFIRTPIKTINMPALEKARDYLFFEAKGVTSVNFPKLKIIEDHAFGSFAADSHLAEFKGPNVETIKTGAFQYAWILKYDFPKVTTLEKDALSVINHIEELRITTPGKITVDNAFAAVKFIDKCHLVLNADKKANGTGNPKVGDDGKTWPAGSNLKWGSITFE